LLLTLFITQRKPSFSPTTSSVVGNDKFVKTFELLADCISTLHKFECGTGTIPSCPLLQAHEAKATKAKLNKAPKHTAGHGPSGTGLVNPDAKRQSSGKPGNDTPSHDNLNCTLAYTDNDMMLTINETNLSLRLCAAISRWVVIAPAALCV
jgi:hypothetical protein